MADAPPRRGGGLTRKLGPLPVWTWAVVAVLVAYLGYKWYTGRTTSAVSATTAPASTSTGTTTAQPTSADTSGTGTADTSGSSELDAAIAALLGEQGANIGAIQGLGQNLADVATNAESQLGYLASNTTTGSFQLATSAVEANTQLAQAALFANQPTTAPTTSTPAPTPQGAPAPSPAAPAPAPAPSSPMPAPVYAATPTGSSFASPILADTSTAAGNTGEFAADVGSTINADLGAGAAGAGAGAGAAYSFLGNAWGGNEPTVSTSPTAASGTAPTHYSLAANPTGGSGNKVQGVFSTH